MTAAMHPELQRVHELAQQGRLDEALELMHRLAEQGEPESLVTLGNFYWQGGPVEQDPLRGREYFRRASDVGHPLGRFFYTNLLANGVFGDRNWAEALERLRDEAALDPKRASALSVIEAMSLDDDGNPVKLPAARSLSPALDVCVFPQLFSASECNHIRAIAEQRYMKSTIHDERGKEIPHPLRSSDGAPLHWLIEDPAIHAMNRRLAAASGTDYANAEPMLVLRYSPGQQYHRHFDALPGLDNQRIKTALVYLNDDYSGGETEFPRIGLKFKGSRGDALIFGNVDREGAPAAPSEHAGLPVVNGIKYLASRWIRARAHVPGLQT